VLLGLAGGSTTVSQAPTPTDKASAGDVLNMGECMNNSELFRTQVASVYSRPGNIC
jgi:hypothetical protein